jgi:hypothetical protein
VLRLMTILFAGMLMMSVRADYCPPDSAQSGGMRDIMLAYVGRGAWGVDDFAPYVAHLDRQGRPTDWFYDSFLFLMFSGAPSGGVYYSGTANFADWKHYLDLLFDPDHCLAALNTAVTQAGERLGDRSRVLPIIIMIPYLDRGLKQFGDCDGDGVDESPADDAARVKAFRWLVDEFLRRFRPSEYPHLKLWGFYWMNEGISGRDEAAVRATADYVHSLKLGMHWIPWFRAPGTEHWREAGFDFVIMQPNYAFMAVPEGAVAPDEDRLAQNAFLAASMGFGVEMELDYATDTDPGQRLELQAYLNHGVAEASGYMNRAVRAYYQSTDSIARLYHSDLPACNRLYDDLYAFHKGTYQRRPISLCEGVPCSLNGVRAPQLTDGKWLVEAGQMDRVVEASAPGRVELVLPALQRVGDVRVRLIATADGRLQPPFRIAVSTSEDGQTFTDASDVSCPSLFDFDGVRAGFAHVIFAPRPARFVRIDLDATPGTRLGVDEVCIFPSAHALWAAGYRLDGGLVGDAGALTGEELSDARVAADPAAAGAVRFAATGRVTFSFPDPPLLASVAAHFRRSSPGAVPRLRAAADGREPTPWAAATGDGAEGWLQVSLGRDALTTLSLELQGGPEVAWDEVYATPARNLARGKPYTVTPAFTARYGDTDGKELTDGLLTERGFGDGRTVGWFGKDVSVLLDLGRDVLVDSARVLTEGGGYGAVNFPDRLELWASSDGSTWRLLRATRGEPQVTLDEQVGGERHQLAWVPLAFEASPARFIKLSAHAGAWLMLSELEVLSRGVNVAASRSYHLTPQPDSAQKYADTGTRLTDGVLSTAGGGWSRAVGWEQDGPIVTLDLLQPAQVDRVRVHCLGGGSGAVWFPRSLRVATSTDGQRWSEETVITGAPEEAGDAQQVAYMTAQFAPREVRYVRVAAERKGWFMVDEVEVYAPEEPTGTGR